MNESAATDAGADANDGGMMALVPGSICSSDGWCWMNPLPAGGLTGLSWTLSHDEAWQVGVNGIILRWSSGGWSFSESGASARLNAVWAADSHDAWAVGQGGAILHWDGNRWSAVAAPVSVDLSAVSGRSPTDVWAAGAAGTLVHWDGTLWTSFTWPDAGTGDALESVWVASATQAWAVGSPGILQWDGTTWTPVAGMPSRFFGVWGAASDDVWAVGPADSVEYPTGRTPSAHWDGTSWTFRKQPPMMSNADPNAPGPDLTSVWGSGHDDVWATNDAAGPWQHWDGSSWSYATTPSVDSATSRLGGGTAGSVFAGLWQIDGASWVDRSTDASSVWVNGMWMASASDGWLVAGGITHWDGAGWSTIVSQVPSHGTLYSVYGTAPDDVWAVGSPGIIMHWDGAQWTTTTVDNSSPLESVWASGRQDAWATSFGHAWRFDGQTWTPSLTGNLGPVWGTASDDVWIGASSGQMMHWDGVSWTTMDTPASTLGGVGAINGSGRNDVWAAGAYGGVMHWDGTSWSLMSQSGQYTALAVHATDDVWAVGYSGAVGHWDGTTWTPSTIHGAQDLSAASALPDGTVWIGGENQLLRRTP
jgi:hypothetical protein